MRVGKFMMAAAVTLMTVSPAVAATANPAAKLSVAKSVRASAPAGKDRQSLGGGLIVPIIALAAVIGGIIAATSGDSSPKSP